MLRLDMRTTNLEEWPLPNLRRTDIPREISIGDLHGNPIKCLHILVREGIFDITSDDYHTLNAIYNKIELDKNDIETFTKILNDKVTITNHKSLILFLGDTIADRGNNDYFTLLIFRKLSINKVSFRIIFSNHDAEFLLQFYEGLENSNTTLFSLPENHHFGSSLASLQNLIALEIVNIVEVNHLVEAYYLPHLALLSHGLLNAETSNLTILYSHAPITPLHIKRLINYFEISLANQHSLISTIDAINEKFHAFLSNNKKGLIPFLDEEAISDLINDRYADLIARQTPELNSFFAKMTSQHPAINIHGHVGDEEIPLDIIGWPFINLDTDLGKYNDTFIGQYPVASILPIPDVKLEIEVKSAMKKPTTSETTKNTMHLFQPDAPWRNQHVNQDQRKQNILIKLSK